jgi:chorismate-pyruvate lyase
VTIASQFLPNLMELIGIFHQVPSELGEFTDCDRRSLPDDARLLLDHDFHMTVTMERYHQSPVAVDVLSVVETADSYCRQILLRRIDNQRVIQFGIVRLKFEFLPPTVVDEIRSRQAPLGRILIFHNVMREVELIQLWRVTTGPMLSRCFSSSIGTTTFGRTARIYCNGEPAIQLLEIVAPLPS